MYQLVESATAWTVCACYGVPAGQTTEDDTTVTVAPGAYVEHHAAWDGTDEGVRHAVLAWAQEQRAMDHIRAWMAAEAHRAV